MWKWLESTDELQRNAYRLDPSPQEGEDLAVKLRDNTLAAVKELMEFLDNFIWKPWATTGKGTIIDRNAAVDELVDVAHFVANLAVALGCTDEEWEHRYQDKQRVNRERQQRPEGYKGVNGA